MRQQADIDFFISRTGVDKEIAIHVSQFLQEAGYKTLLQDEDFGHQDFMACMEKGFAQIERGGRLIALLSSSYAQSNHCRVEYRYPLIDDPENSKQRLIVFRIEECEPSGFLKPIPYVNLVPILQDISQFKEAVLIAVGHKEKDIPSWFGALHRAPQQIIHPEIRATPNFTGRQKELQDLKTALWSGESHMAAITQPVAAHGLGGVGKSVLAKEYAWQNRELYTGVWWLDAEQENGIIDGLIGLGSKFILGLSERQDRNAAANTTLDYLATHYGRADKQEACAKPWLLIFDNIESEDILRRNVPKGGAQMLLTTRESNFSAGIIAVPVDTWPLDEAIAYLRDESGREFTDQEITDLAEMLGCMPLALSHAAAFLRQNKAILPESYLNNIQKWLGKAPKDAAYPDSVFATYQEAINKCEEEAEGARAILYLAAFFASDDIPFELYSQAKEHYPEDLQSIVSDEDKMTSALGQLDRLSLIRLDMTNMSFSLHRLVQAAAQDELGNEQENWLASAIKAVAIAYPGDDFHDWPTFERLLPHGRHLIKQASDEIDAPLAHILSHIALYLDARADYNAAEQMYRRALAISEVNFGPDHPAVATDLNNLAQLLKTTNQLKEAESMFHRALKINEESFGPDHPDVAIDLNNLAGLLFHTHRFKEAEPMYLRALKINEESFGPDHPYVAITLGNLAELLRNTHKLDKAEPMYHRALKIIEKNFGPNHPDIATNLNNLAILLSDTNRLEEAEQNYRRALKIDETNYGSEHPKIANRLNNLAGLLCDTNRIDEGEPMFRRALAIAEASLPEGHPNIDLYRENLNICLALKSANGDRNK